MFDSIRIIPKLNAEEDREVHDLSRLITETAELHDVRINKYGGTSRTLFVSIGGDGTMLEAMRQAATFGGVAFGVNLGRVGFLTEIDGYLASQSPNHARRFKELFRQIFEGENIRIEERTTLKWSAVPDDVLACNEFSLSRDLADSMINYRLFIDDVDGGVHRANSLVIATATGSTAYSLSAGGALLFPSLDAFQIVPVAPMTLTARPIIVGGNATIRVRIWGGKTSIRRDGTLQSTRVDDNTTEVSASEYRFTRGDPTRVLHFNDWNFFEVLSDKLGWDKD